MGRDSTVLIVGGGLSGLFAALLISRKYPGYQVVLAERGSELGGLYSSFDAHENGFFDHGPHIFYESGIEEVDAQIRDVLPDSDWIWLEGNRKDISGAYYNGRLQTYSHYPDLRTLEPDQYRACVADFFMNLGHGRATGPASESAGNYFRSRFGEFIAELVSEPILRKIWGKPGLDLDQFAARIVSMDRVILFDAEKMSDLMTSNLVRERLAYPDQLNLPQGLRASTQRGFYPRKFGMLTVISAIRRELERRQVRVLTRASLGKFEIEKGRIVSVTASIGEETFDLGALSLVHWTAGLLPLVRQLGIQHTTPSREPGRKVVYANLISRRPPRMGEAYYFYCYDPGYRTFRATNYASYCPNAEGTQGYPISVELHFEAEEVPDDVGAASLAVRELLQFGVIESPEQITYAHARGSDVGTPVPTLSGARLAETATALIAQTQLANLTVGGGSPDKNLFFLHDILADSYRKLVNWEGWRP